jgi:hypothetical protein
MSDTNTISITFSKDFRPIIETAFNDFRQYLKDKVQNELIIEQAKIKASKDKWDAALKTLNRNGALDKLMFQLADKFMGEPGSSPKTNTHGKTDENYSNRVRNSKSTRAEKETTLVSLIFELNRYIDSDSDFRVSLNSAIDKISVHESIHNLLKCTSEDDARLTLKFIQFNISVDDMPHLLTLNTMLTDSEKELVEKIVNFEL